MARITRIPALQCLLAGALLVTLAGCGSGVGVVEQNGAAVASVAATQTTTQTTNQPTTPATTPATSVIVAANGSPPGNLAMSCSPYLHCAP